MYIAIINADWGENISVGINAKDQKMACIKVQEIKDDYGDPEIESKVISVEEV